MVIAGSVVLATYSCGPIFNAPDGDSSVFIYVARCIQRGLMPYLDVFDHKGPLLYLLDYWGLCITDNHLGIWLIEATLFALTTIFGYCRLRRVAGKMGAFIFTIAYASFLSYYGDGGNMTESWASCFIVVILGCLISGVSKHNWAVKDCMWSGMAVAAIALLRPNMIASGVAFVAIVMCDCLLRKSHRELMAAALMFCAGTLVVVLPIILWLSAGGALMACLEDYILFNIAYASPSGHGCESFHPWAWHTLVFMGLGAAPFLIPRKRAEVFYSVVAVAVLSWLIVAAKPTFGHYFGVMAAPLAFLFAVGPNVCNCKKIGYMLCIVFAVVSIGQLTRRSVDIIRSVKNSSVKNRSVATESELRRLNGLIDDKNSVTVLGNMCNVYELLCVSTPWKYPYQLQPAAISQKIRGEIVDEISKRSSKYLILPRNYNGFPKSELGKRYQVIFATQNFILFQSTYPLSRATSEGVGAE